MKFAVDIPGPQRKTLNDFGDPCDLSPDASIRLKISANQHIGL